MIVVPDVLDSAGEAGRRGAGAQPGADHRGHRLGRQDHDQGSAARMCSSARCGKVHASAASFNNHWGVPLTLARMPADTRLRRVRDRHEPSGRNPPAGEDGAPARRDHHDRSRRRISGISRTLDEIARAKAEIFEGVVDDGGAALINRDDQQFALLEEAGQGGRRRAACSVSAKNAARTSGWFDTRPWPDGSAITASIGGERMQLQAAGAPGEHSCRTALAVLGAASLAGADLANVARGAGHARAEKGRGQAHAGDIAGGPRSR